MSSDPTPNLQRRITDLHVYLDLITDPDLIERAEQVVDEMASVINKFLDGDLWADVQEDFVVSYWPDEIDGVFEANQAAEALKRLVECQEIVDRALNHVINERLKFMVMQRTWGAIAQAAERR